MCGDRDPLVPVDQAADLARSVRDGRLFVAPGAGHDLTNEQPELCATAMLGFYRSTEAVARARAGAVDAARRFPMTTLLALYRRPDGGPEAQATFERRYATEHLPLVAGTPGLRETRVHRVVEALGAETDLVIATTMRFDDRDGARRRSRLGRDARGRPQPARDRARPRDAVRARGPAGDDRRGFPGCGYCLNEVEERS